MKELNCLQLGPLPRLKASKSGRFNIVTIIDYGIGNVFSVSNAFNKIGVQTDLTRDPKKIRKASRLILPGVGAFKVGMDNLSRTGLIDPIREFVATGNPFMGICLGMQMLMNLSYEFGEHKGLGFIPGTVNKIPSENRNGDTHKIPHIGWSRIDEVRNGFPWKNSVLNGTPAKNSFYFVHSFSVSVQFEKNLLAETDYNGIKVQAAVQNDNVMGFQFHPEKSADQGLGVLESFINL